MRFVILVVLALFLVSCGPRGQQLAGEVVKEPVPVKKCSMQGFSCRPVSKSATTVSFELRAAPSADLSIADPNSMGREIGGGGYDNIVVTMNTTSCVLVSNTVNLGSMPAEVPITVTFTCNSTVPAKFIGTTQMTYTQKPYNKPQAHNGTVNYRG